MVLECGACVYMCLSISKCHQVTLSGYGMMCVLKQLLVLVGQMSVSYQTQREQDNVIGSTCMWLSLSLSLVLALTLSSLNGLGTLYV